MRTFLLCIINESSMLTHILSVPKQVNKQGCGHPTNWLLEFEGQQGESLLALGCAAICADRACAGELPLLRQCAAMLQELVHVLTCRSVMLICLPLSTRSRCRPVDPVNPAAPVDPVDHCRPWLTVVDSGHSCLLSTLG